MLAKLITEPNVTRYENGEESEEEFGYWAFLSAKHLVTGALAIAERHREDDDKMDAICELLAAFDAAVQRGSDAINAARRKDLPRLTIDEFTKLLGDVGGAEVKILVNREGVLTREQYHVGRKYTIGSKDGRSGLVEVPFAPPGRSDKKNGKAKEKAA